MLAKRSLPASRLGVVLRRPLVAASCAAVVLVVVLVSLGSLALADTLTFPDVPAGHPYSAAISDLASRGVISGYPNGNFAPANPVTRQQFAKMIVLTGNYPVSEADLCPFDDVERSGPASLYPDNYVAVCAAHQITKGKTPTSFDPTGNITRYQAISMVVRAAEDLRPGLLAIPPVGFAAINAWGADATHGANVTRAEFNGLLANLDRSVDPAGFMTRGEIAQMLHNLLALLAPTPATTTTLPSTTTTASTTTTTMAPTTSSTTSSTTTTSTTSTTLPGHPGWQSLNFVTTGSPAVAVWPSGEIDVLARGTDNALWATFAGSAGWSGTWLSLGGALAPGSGPAAVVRAGGLDIFVRGWDNALWYRRYSGGSLTDWTSLGGLLSGDPGVVSWGDDRLDVFVRGPLGHLFHKAYAAGTWFEWQDLGGALSEDAGVGVASWAASVLDVFVKGSDGALWQRHYETGAWSDWVSLGSTLTSGPCAASKLAGHVAVAGRGGDGTLWGREFLSDWSPWANWLDSVGFAGDPDMVFHDSRYDIVVRGLDGNVWHRWVDNTGRHP